MLLEKLNFLGRLFCLISITNLDLTFSLTSHHVMQISTTFLPSYLRQTVMFCFLEGTNYNCGHIVTAKIKQSLLMHVETSAIGHTTGRKCVSAAVAQKVEVSNWSFPRT